MASVVVVGAGIAGLACAWRLQQAGHRVQVLERESAAGGRMRSERHGDFVVDRGAQFIASGYRHLHALTAEVGIADRVCPVARASNAILRNGRLESGDYGSPLRFLQSRLLSLGAKVRLPRILFEVWRQRRVLDPWSPELAADIDREDMPTYLRRIVGDEAFEYVFAPAFSSTFDSDPEDLSAAFVLLALRFLQLGFRLQSFDCGIGLLTHTLAQRVPLRTGCQVLSVETDAHGGRVRLRTEESGEEISADAVVVAVPGSRTLGICPALSPSERDFFERVRYVRGIIVFLMLDMVPPTLPYYGVAFPRREGLALYGLAVDQFWSAPARWREPCGSMLPHSKAPEASPRLAFAGDYLIGPYTEAALTSGLRAAGEIGMQLGA